MRTRELSRSEWPEFFDSFGRQHEGRLVTLEILGADIGAQVEGRELALAGILVEWDEVHGDQIAVLLGTKPDDHVTHNISRPSQVSLEQTDEGADAVLAIKSADETIALLRLDSPVFPEMVDAVVVQRPHPSL